MPDPRLPGQALFVRKGGGLLPLLNPSTRIPMGLCPRGGGPISFSYLLNSEVRSNLQVRWVKLSVGHGRTAAHPLLCISVAYPQASSCLMFCDRKVPMVL